jgi:ribosomal protein L2
MLPRASTATTTAERDMKGMDQKKTEKKKPEKSLKEKRAAKKDKKAGK